MLLKLGAVPYLNARPLIHYLPQEPVLAPPAPLVRLLRLGTIDIAMAPIVALFENPHYLLVPNICIGSNGPVKSVKLFFHKEGVDATNVSSIYLDMESRTSALLIRILLQYKYGRDLNTIRFICPIPSRDIEASVLIGDKAMKQMPTLPTLDLGDEWTSWIKLPFVYAAWISRLPSLKNETIEELQKARNLGIQNLDAVLPEKLIFPKEASREYLQNIVYTLGSKELEGMELFRDYLLRAGLIANQGSSPQQAIL